MSTPYPTSTRFFPIVSKIDVDKKSILSSVGCDESRVKARVLRRGMASAKFGTIVLGYDTTDRVVHKRWSYYLIIATSLLLSCPEAT